MRFFKKGQILTLPLLVFLLILIASPTELDASKGVCAGAYIKCMISAALLGITSGALAAGWAVGCQLGVMWCLEYFE